MRFTRILTLGGLIALMGGATPALAQKGGRQRLDSIAFVREFPLAFVYEGVARFRTQDFQGAINRWEEYLRHAGKDADTASINWMIHEAVIQAYPEALVYEGLARINGGDHDGAIRAWERFQELAPAGSDTATVAQMTERVFFEAYPMARLYQGVQFYLAHQYDHAITSWEKFLVSCATEAERGQVRELIAEARKRSASETLARAQTF